MKTSYFEKLPGRGSCVLLSLPILRFDSRFDHLVKERRKQMAQSKLFVALQLCPKIGRNQTTLGASAWWFCQNLVQKIWCRVTSMGLFSKVLQHPVMPPGFLQLILGSNFRLKTTKQSQNCLFWIHSSILKDKNCTNQTWFNWNFGCKQRILKLWVDFCYFLLTSNATESYRTPIEVLLQRLTATSEADRWWSLTGRGKPNPGSKLRVVSCELWCIFWTVW